MHTVESHSVVLELKKSSDSSRDQPYEANARLTMNPQSILTTDCDKEHSLDD